MKISEKLTAVLNFIEFMNLEWSESTTIDGLKSELSKIDEIQNFINSVDFLNEMNKLFNHERRIIEAEILKRNER